MKKSLLMLISISTLCFITHGAQRQFTMTFTQLQQHCARYPEQGQGNHVPKSFLTRHTLLQTVRSCTALNTIRLRSHQSWIGNNSPFASNTPTFAPFVQKLNIPHDSTVLFFGDLHGNIHSLMRSLEYLRKQGIIDTRFRIIKPNTYLIFLGDYVDRGDYGIEVIYTLMRLKIANPSTVVLVRGNHEDTRLNKRYGFGQELNERAHFAPSDLPNLQQWYTTMPLALYIGVNNGIHTDYIVCCHGGPELGFNARTLLEAPEDQQFCSITTLQRANNVQNLPMAIKHDVLRYIPQHELENITPASPTKPVTIGLMWADVIEDIRNYTSAIVAYKKHRGWIYGKQLTAHWLQEQSGPQHTVQAIIRGHQHYGDMLKQLIANKGLVNLWNGMVYTLLSAPVARTNFPYDACTILKTSNSYDRWTIEPILVS